MSDPQLRPYTREYLKSVARPRHSTDADRVREIVEALLPTGRCSLQQVARTLAVDRKTVHRRLAEAGETFSSVLASTRAELAQQYVGHQERTLTHSAELLGFTSVSTFSRWFRAQFGSSPTAWRAARRGAWLTRGRPARPCEHRRARTPQGAYPRCNSVNSSALRSDPSSPREPVPSTRAPLCR